MTLRDSIPATAPEPTVAPTATSAEAEIATSTNSTATHTEKPKRTPQPKTERTIHADTLTRKGTESATLTPADTISADTVMVNQSTPAMVFGPEVSGSIPAMLRHGNLDGSSWVMLGLLTIFIFVCLKFRRSRRYFQVLVRDLTDTRRRDNMFDNTVRETSFLLLLNIMSLISFGVLLYYLLFITDGGHLRGTVDRDMGICISVCLAYGLLIWGAYWGCGTVFYDARDARIWVRGHAAAQGLMGAPLFILSLVAMFYANLAPAILWTAGILFCIMKIIFIIKGMRIFMRSRASILLFFYYLCILEVIPIIGVFVGANALCQAAA